MPDLWGWARVTQSDCQATTHRAATSIGPCAGDRRCAAAEWRGAWDSDRARTAYRRAQSVCGRAPAQARGVTRAALAGRMGARAHVGPARRADRLLVVRARISMQEGSRRLLPHRQTRDRT